MIMIECWQKVAEVEIADGLDDGQPPMWTRVINLGRRLGSVDVFAKYYEAGRETKGRAHAPHHAFAAIQNETGIAPFVQQFGVPDFERRNPLMVRELLVEARRLRLLMQAWEALRARRVPTVVHLLAELSFALHHAAGWYYWPPHAFVTDDLRHRDCLTSRRQFVEQEREQRSERLHEELRPKTDAGYTDLEAVRSALMSTTGSLCETPLAEIQFSPTIGSADGDRIDMHWEMRPVRFMGESPDGDVYEEPFIGAPYFLMFLLDQTEGRATRICADASCQKPFRGSARTKFCSWLHGHRAAQRKYRERSQRRAGGKRRRRS